MSTGCTWQETLSPTKSIVQKGHLRAGRKAEEKRHWVVSWETDRINQQCLHASILSTVLPSSPSKWQAPLENKGKQHVEPKANQEFAFIKTKASFCCEPCQGSTPLICSSSYTGCLCVRAHFLYICVPFLLKNSCVSFPLKLIHDWVRSSQTCQWDLICSFS